jgi:hypothetical protein
MRAQSLQWPTPLPENALPRWLPFPPWQSAPGARTNGVLKRVIAEELVNLMAVFLLRVELARDPASK